MPARHHPNDSLFFIGEREDVIHMADAEEQDDLGVAVVDVLLRINHGADDTWFRTVFSLSPANLFDGAWWEPFTYMWLHAPPIGFWITHIFFNMLTLSIFGKPVEGRIGSRRFGFLYLVGGLAAAGAYLGQAWWEVGGSWAGLHTMTQEIVGASGAVLAVVAAFAVYFPDARLFIFPFPFPVRASRAVRVFILLSLAMMFVPALSFIGHSAHIGGLLAGFFLARAWMKSSPQPPVPEVPARPPAAISKTRAGSTLVRFARGFPGK